MYKSYEVCLRRMELSKDEKIRLEKIFKRLNNKIEKFKGKLRYIIISEYSNEFKIGN